MLIDNSKIQSIIFAMAVGFESTIDIYLRVRPISSGAAALYEVDPEEGNVTWTIPRNASLGMANHQREHYNFKFNGIFNTESKQDEVFLKVAHKVVVNSLEGYNGTIFAYGQTGSGKTYTINGGAERYVDRGIIPRSISQIFSEVAQRSEYTYTLHFSYLEVYNEMGYDLLNPDHESKALEDLPKVTLLEDEDSVFHLRNLSQHLATNEEEALNLLFVGDTNRTISSTPMNMASSRSHCIFTAYILACKAGEDKVRKSKLNLVDLAGSERVWKTGVDGQILKEAKYINLSLHFLEQVIVALQERSQGKTRTHIPYRNSMMTSVLRDSIGGNCRTVMIATVTVALDQLEETISTCRFAQRVAMVSNQVTLNEEVDPNLVIKRLKQQVFDLKEELAVLRGENEDRPPLSASDIEIVRSQVTNFVNDAKADAILQCGGSMMHIRAAFQILKEMLKDSIPKETHSPEDFLKRHARNPPAIVESNDGTALQARVKDLQYQLQQRDNEIQILVAFIRKRGAGVEASVSRTTTRTNSRNEGQVNESNSRQPEITFTKSLLPLENPSRTRNIPEPWKPESSELDSKAGTQRLNEVDRVGVMNQQDNYEKFLKNNGKMDTIEENKSILKTMYAEAKTLGEKVNHARENINDLKERIEKHRLERARDYLVSGTGGATLERDQEEDHLISIIDTEKRTYKEGFSRLRDVKKEIEHLLKLLQQNRARLQVFGLSFTRSKFDFYLYLNEVSHNEGTESLDLVSTDAPNMDFPTCLIEPNVQHMASSTSNTKMSPSLYSTMNDKTKQSSCNLDGAKTKGPYGASIGPLNKQSEKRLEEGLDCGRSDKQPQKEAKNSKPPIVLTGNAATDADILAFYKARSGILKSGC